MQGQSFIAVDPEAFAPNFQSRLGKFIQEMRQLTSVRPSTHIRWYCSHHNPPSLQSEDGEPVLVAGDPERAHIQKVREEGGIFYHTNLLNHLVNLF